MTKLVGKSLNQNLELYRAIAQNIKHLRIELGKTQTELSKLIHISHDSWCLIESGKSRIEYGVMLAIAELLCLSSVEYLSKKDFYKTVKDDWKEQVISKIDSRQKQ